MRDVLQSTLNIPDAPVMTMSAPAQQKVQFTNVSVRVCVCTCVCVRVCVEREGGVWESNNSSLWVDSVVMITTIVMHPCSLIVDVCLCTV